jgi:hypothetical protein
MEYRIGMASQGLELLTSTSEYFFFLPPPPSQPQNMKSRIKIHHYHNLSFFSIEVIIHGQTLESNIFRIKFPFLLRRKKLH